MWKTFGILLQRSGSVNDHMRACRRFDITLPNIALTNYSISTSLDIIQRPFSPARGAGEAGKRVSLQVWHAGGLSLKDLPPRVPRINIRTRTRAHHSYNPTFGWACSMTPVQAKGNLVIYLAITSCDARRASTPRCSDVCRCISLVWYEVPLIKVREPHGDQEGPPLKCTQCYYTTSPT